MAEGYLDDAQVSAYYQFFQGDIDVTLKELIKDTTGANLLALDLSDALKNFHQKPKREPSVDLLISLWRGKCQDNFFNPYYQIILFCLTKGFSSFDKVIESVDLSMSEAMIVFCLSKVGIKNENGKYDISKLKNDSVETNDLNEMLCQSLNSEESVKNILNLWIKKVNSTLEDNNSEWYKQINLATVFYRFIQLGFACDQDNRETLSDYLVNFINSDEISCKDKKAIIEIITEECKKYKNPLIGGTPEKTPLEILFNTNENLITTINNFNNQNPLAYFDCFKAIVEDRQ